MSYNRNSRREFLRKLACVACGGGTAAMIPQLRMIGSALANTKALTDYKALVCIYLSGGNDGWNMLVPADSTRYNTYAAAPQRRLLDHRYQCESRRPGTVDAERGLCPVHH